MLARRLATILPPLDRTEALTVTRIHNVADLLPPGPSRPMPLNLPEGIEAAV